MAGARNSWPPRNVPCWPARCCPPTITCCSPKTTARARYDSILATLAREPELFDAILLNARGEVCEGARSNVFVERDGTLLTPPVDCGLLPGVLRRSLLDSGAAVERVLRAEDLQRSTGVFLGNAVRALIPVIVDR
ncbi:aminotransferase class IV [Accumulibacter sp.]|uniref:aminotransferase class IV n=1 Tax=Accumulibacter sp. TaxID=2053492 RepID=UPI0025FE7173|nr:aminotransferase class IV [Accumulibacter sp.]MCM8596177.1 aminotransferase class IV [Accumulibacter sp.]MDS4050326.1 aminotransferase class IV [Accumulibacter sp.]